MQERIIIENQQKLRTNEIVYKHIYKSNYNEFFDNPMPYEQFEQLLRGYSNQDKSFTYEDIIPYLNESDFFEKRQDIAIFQHYRYMPGIYHEHSFFEVAFILSGSVENYILDSHFTLQSGDVIILAPHTQHAVFTYSDDTIMLNMLIRSSTFNDHFMHVLPENDLLLQFFAKTLYHPSDSPYLLFHTGKDEELYGCIRNIVTEYSRNRMYKNTMLVSLASIFFTTLLRKHEKNVVIPLLKSHIMNETTIFILQYIQNNYATVTLKYLSEFFNYSERQIQRIITTTTGLSFSENIKKLRMERAAQLLTNTHSTIAEIADELGYYDTSNFRHVFNDYYGMTPQQYRQA